MFRIFQQTFSQKLLSVIYEMYTNQKTVIHNFLLLKEFAIPVYLPASTYLTSLLTWWTKNAMISKSTNKTRYVKYEIKYDHLWNSWNHCLFSLKMKFRSRSFRVVYWSISVCGLSVVRPRDEPFRSKRLWIGYSEQNRFPIMTKRTWVLAQKQTVSALVMVVGKQYYQRVKDGEELYSRIHL